MRIKKIINVSTRLEALHYMAMMRKMELNGAAFEGSTADEYDSIYDGCEKFFSANPEPIWTKWENSIA